jgi:hypothetical protein
VNSGSGNPVNFLYINIGRGHPHYLDGIVECMRQEAVGDVADVFGLTSGLSRGAWNVVRLAYQGSGSGTPISTVYNRLRLHADYNRSWGLHHILGGQLRRHYLDDETRLVVSHPLIVALMREKPNLVYQHGEIVAPRESWVRGGHRIVVPTGRVADTLAANGFTREQIFVSGLCIEPALLTQAEAAFHARIERLAGPTPLCGAFFATGAEPRPHIARLVAAAVSVVQAGGTALIFASAVGQLASRAETEFTATGVELVCARTLDEVPRHIPDALLCLYSHRSELNELTARLFGMFDYFVSAAHERSNWAMGLGLPMLLIGPSLGSYAPLNREVLLQSRVCHLIESRRDAVESSVVIGRLQRAGELVRMAQMGWGHFDIQGFRCIADALAVGSL